MCEEARQQSYSGVVFELRVFERGKVIDHAVLRSPEDFRLVTQKYVGV